MGWVELWIWVPFVTLVTLYLFLLFPDGRLPTPRWRPVAWLGGAFAAMAAAGVAFTLGSDRPNLPALRNPFGLAPAVVPLGVAGAGLAGLVSCAVLAAWSLVVRSRRGTDETRQQIKWLACSGCLVALALVPAVALSLTPGWPARVASGAVSAAVLAMPTTVAIAVLRYRLYDIDRIISRTLAYAIITGVLAGVYAALVLLATSVLGVRTPVAVAAATLAAAALFAPVRWRVQHAADRRCNHERYASVTSPWPRSPPGSRTRSTWTPSAKNWPTSCKPRWNPPRWVKTARPPLLTGPTMLTDGSAPNARVVTRMQTRAEACSNDSGMPFTEELPL